MKIVTRSQDEIQIGKKRLEEREDGSHQEREARDENQCSINSLIPANPKFIHRLIRLPCHQLNSNLLSIRRAYVPSPNKTVPLVYRSHRVRRAPGWGRTFVWYPY